MKRINFARTGFVSGIGFLALSGWALPAHAMTLPAAQTYEAGIFGPLKVSGGFDGLFYATSGTGTDSVLHKDGEVNKSTGALFKAFDIDVKKTTGQIRFRVEVKMADSIYFGKLPREADFRAKSDSFTLSPVYMAYVTWAPTSNFNISVGQIGSLLGYDSSDDWKNASIVDTPLYYTTNSSSRGIMTSYTLGNLSATVAYGDGFDDGVWNVLQELVTYNFNSNNSLSAYGLQTLGTKGAYTRAYGGGTNGTGYGGAAWVNNNVYGAYYSYTAGNLTLVPQVQYVYSKINHRLDLDKTTSIFGTALEADYQFGNSPWSLGGNSFYYTSKGGTAWYMKPNSAGYGMTITPSWIVGHVFIRGEGGLFHLTTTGTNTGGFGKEGTDRNQLLGLLETGFVF